MQFAKRTRRLATAALITPLVASALSGSAYAAGGCTGAPGASAIQQYCEAVPEAGGGSQHPGNTSSKSKGLSKKTAATLSASGADGAQVEALAGGAPSVAAPATTNAPKTTKEKAAHSPTSPAAGTTPVVTGVKISGPNDPSASPLKAATHAVASGPTVGGGVVWGLVGVTALGGIGALFFRRRSGGGFDPPNES